jgi:hypothetical protein
METTPLTSPHRRERAVNRRVQGDIGEPSAMEWLSICTNGGNQSWTGLTKKFDAAKVDYLFVLVGDGRRWFIPACYVEAAREVTLGWREVFGVRDRPRNAL